MRTVEYAFPQTKPGTKNLAVALGYFDGVHVGHRRLLSVLVDEAKRKGLTPCIFTFAESPAKTKNTQSIIYNNQEKCSIFEGLGIETIFFARFDSISSLSPDDFVKKVIIDSLGAEVCVVGYNFRFGHKASGNAYTLAEIMAESNRHTIIIDEQTVGGMGVSSTKIRGLIESKSLDIANTMLGTPYFIRGRVEKGLGLGKVFGFPTINTPIRDDSPLPTGVYRSAVKIKNRLFTGITNIGKCPTVKERDVHAETLIANFEGDLYGEELRIYLLEYLREERLFDTIDDLKQQIHLDKEISIKKNGDLKWLATGLNLP